MFTDHMKVCAVAALIVLGSTSVSALGGDRDERLGRLVERIGVNATIGEVLSETDAAELRRARLGALAAQLQENQRLAAEARERRRIGITVDSQSRADARRYHLDPHQVVKVGSLESDGTALAFGVLENDLIIRVNGKPARFETLRDEVRNTEPGRAVVLDIVRRGFRASIEVPVYDLSQGAQLARH